MADYKYDKDKLLDATNGGLDVFLHYFPNCKKGNHSFPHFKLREEERTPSANVFKSGDVYLIKDHGSGKTYNAFGIVMEKEGIDFSESCKWIAATFGVSGEKVSFSNAKIEVIPALNSQFDNQYVYDYMEAIPESWLKNISPFLTNEICQRFNLYAVNSFTQVKTYPADTSLHKSKNTHKYAGKTMQIVTKSTADYPIMVYDQGDWQKIYQPKGGDYRFRHAPKGAKTDDYLFGLEDLKKQYDYFVNHYDGDDEHPKLDKVVIASGGSDGLNIAALGCPVVWGNSETFDLDYKDYQLLKEFAKNIYYLGDLDNTGVREALKLGRKYIDIKLIWLPQSLKNKKIKGKAGKDFKDYVFSSSISDYEHLKRKFEALLYDALPYRFWDLLPKKKETDPSKYFLNNEALYRFLRYNGFYRFEDDAEKEDFSFVRENKGIVKRVKQHHVSTFPADYVRKTRSNIQLLNFVHRSGQLSEKSLMNLRLKDFNFKDCGYNHQLLFFKNGIWRIEKDGVKKFEYGSKYIHTQVWEDKIIPHDVTLNSEPIFEITKLKKLFDIDIKKNDNHFLNYLVQTSRVHWRKLGDKPFKNALKKLDENAADYDSKVEAIAKNRKEYTEKTRFNIAEPGLTASEIKEQKQHLINKIFTFGYLCHKQKIMDRAWCAFGMDYRVSSVKDSNGGSGKSLFFNVAVRQVLMNCKSFNGRDKKLFDNAHKYDGITKHSDYVLFDDLNQYFPFDAIFSEITGDFNVNPKNNKPYSLSFDESPKFAMTSNFGIFNNDPTTERRLLYTIFSDIYHPKLGEDKTEHKPADDFGKMLFQQFTDQEWSDFFNFVAQSIQFYLSCDEKINPPMASVHKRNSLQSIGDDFKEWADNFFTDENETLNNQVVKDFAYDNFKEKSGLNWKITAFKKSVATWCEFYNYQFNPPEVQNTQGKNKHHDSDLGKITEYFYIKTPNVKKVNKTSKSDDSLIDGIPF